MVEDPRAAAMALFPPCYISGWTAAEHWGLTEQISNTIVVYSATPQRRSELEIGGVKYRVRRVPEDMLFGTTRVWSGPTAVEMATVHRVIVDVLDAPEMGGAAARLSTSSVSIGGVLRRNLAVSWPWPAVSDAAPSSKGWDSLVSISAIRTGPGWSNADSTSPPGSPSLTRPAHDKVLSSRSGA